jgi:glyoxalase family protein
MELLAQTMGFQPAGEAGPRFRFRGAGQGPGTVVDVVHLPKWERGWGGAGAVHHVAWRTPDDAQQLAWREELSDAGVHVTPVMDRQYFRSIYFREPGGVLFEVATDPPGFLRDEAPEALGTRLMLPSWLEARRAEVEASLPELDLPGRVLYEHAGQASHRS